MKKSLGLGVLLLAAVVIVFVRCGNNTNNGGGLNGTFFDNAVGATFLDANGDPIQGGLVYVPQGNVITKTAVVALENGACPDPTEAVEVTDDSTEIAGCTDSNGFVELPCDPGSVLTVRVFDNSGNEHSQFNNEPFVFVCESGYTVQTDTEQAVGSPTPTPTIAP